MSPVISAHGLGGAKDLPIPAEYATAGAVLALVISFVVLATAWRRPRFEGAVLGRPVPGIQRVVDSTAFLVAVRLLGLAAFGYVALTLLAGEDRLTNPVFGIVYVLLWVGIVPLSLALGPVWKALSPWRSIAWLLSKLLRTDPEEGVLPLPEKWGLWPAAIGLYAFVWLELVSPSQTMLGTLRLWLVVYGVAMVMGALVWGTRFLGRADPFEVYSSLLAKLSVWGRRDGELVLLSPLRNLATTTPLPGLAAVMAVLLGSTAYDSFRESPPFVQYVQGSDVDQTLVTNLALLGFVLLAGAILTVGTMATGVDHTTRRRDLPRRFAHSMMPIVVGYMVAHYFSYFVFMGQQTLIQMSDPLSRGDDWFGTGDWAVNNWLIYQATALAVLKVVAVVTGHVLGAVASHDRAVHLLPERHHVTGQLSLLAAMVAFTAGGLYLLFAG
ncbi:hypothetical protein IEQ44_04030 [Nocardioides sp. Y6]|uniref:Fenitrothion hydrolase n=1 Tax=Nocardioides malaquae TaxID=2773426 RepID=A0ABR9RQH3_9ACTN|nr:hypothetical protein [Nocardioides malaquae]MBE7323816.1 hypothetical protein [Nocardioides malaquae]